MKLDFILNKLSTVKDFIARYAVILFIVFVALVFGFLTLRIANYSNHEPTEVQIEETLSSIKTVKLDEESIEKIEELQDRNINLESLFNNGRANPFE
jgi:hypothetical protein